MYTWGTKKFPELCKKIYLRYLCKFETLVPFEVLPLWLDAAIELEFSASVGFIHEESVMMHGHMIAKSLHFSADDRFLANSCFHNFTYYTVSDHRLIYECLWCVCIWGIFYNIIPRVTQRKLGKQTRHAILIMIMR